MGNYKEGDRFKWSDQTGSVIIWEVLERIDVDTYKSVVLEVSGRWNTRNKDDIVTWGVSKKFDTYLGNFGKANNFDNLYNKLNNKWEH